MVVGIANLSATPQMGDFPFKHYLRITLDHQVFREFVQIQGGKNF